MHVEWYDLISWGIALTSLIAFLYERKKNDRMKYYMVLQGLLQSYVEKSKKYASLNGDVDRGDIAPTKETIKLILKMVYSETRETVAMLYGIMKALDLKKDFPIDVDEFLNKNQVNNLPSSIPQINQPLQNKK